MPETPSGMNTRRRRPHRISKQYPQLGRYLSTEGERVCSLYPYRTSRKRKLVALVRVSRAQFKISGTILYLLDRDTWLACMWVCVSRSVR